MIERTRSIQIPLVVAGLALLLYLLTLAPTVTGTDAGELILAAYSAGIAHAPGFPTWVILAWPVAHLPLGTPAWRLNLLSALAAMLTLPVLWGWMRRLPGPHIHLTPSQPAPPRRKPAHKARSLAYPSLGRHQDWPLLAVLLAFAAGRSFWPWATTAEVYTLNTLLIALTLLLLFRWSHNAAQTSPPAPASGWELPLAALCYGLALGVHLATTALLAPAIALWLYWHRQHLPLSLFLKSALALALGLLTYLWLPLRAAANPALNWGDPNTPYRFWRHVTAAQYRSNINLAPASILNQLRFGLSLTFWQYSPLGLPLILRGLYWGWRQQRRLTIFLLVGALSVSTYAVLYAIEDDQDTYYILAHLLLLPPLLWGLSKTLGVTDRLFRIRRWGQQRRWGFFTLLLPLLTLLFNLPTANRANYWYHYDYYHNLTAALTPGATLFTRDWQFYSPSIYFQRLLDDRPDLRIIDVELMRRDWYLEDLERWYPELTTPAAGELATYRRLRDAWEHDPQGFERNPIAVNDLQNAYLGTINALIAAANTLGDVYISHDQEPGIAAAYTWVPVGLTFRLDPPNSAYIPPPELHWDLGHLQNQWSHLPDDPARKVARVHAVMLQNRAIYLARHSDPAPALSALNLARQIDPTDPFTAQLISKIQSLSMPK